MKKLVLIIIMLSAANLIFGQNIEGSAHDFSDDAWSNGQICLPCHTPHNADISVINAPLWNHKFTTSTFDLYNSPTLHATMAQPSASSKMCLSCHDVTVALDSFGDITGTHNINESGLIGTILTDDHPVSFVYNTALANSDGGLYDPSVNSAVAGMLFSGQMECASCHDVHNGSGINKLLVKSNAGSDLCLTCHIK